MDTEKKAVTGEGIVPRDILRTSTTLTDRESGLVRELVQIKAERDELLAVCKAVAMSFDAPHRFSKTEAIIKMRAAIAKAKGRGE